MGKVPIYMLKVFADVPSALVIDGKAVSKTGEEGVVVPVSGAEMFVQIFSLKGDSAPICRYITLEKPCMTGTDERCELYMLPEDVFELHAYFDSAGPGRSLPYVLSSINVPLDRRMLRVSVYCDREFAMAVEEGDKVILSSVFEGTVTKASIYTKQIGQKRFLFVHAGSSRGDQLCIAELGGEVRMALKRKIFSLNLTDTSVTLGSVIYDTKMTEIFTSDMTLPQDIRTAATDANSLLAAAVYAAVCGHQAAAMRVMSQSLAKDISFSDLREFVGTPEKVCENEKGLTLVYEEANGVKHARVLRAAVNNGKIVNIEEL